MRRSIVGLVALVMGVGLGSSAIAADVPEQARSRVDRLVTQLGIDTPWRAAAVEAIDPDPSCDDNTSLRVWLQSQLAGVSPSTLDVLLQFGVLDWAFFWTLGGDPDPSDEFFGVDGEYTREQLRRQREHLGFWTVDLDDVFLQAAHGAVVADDARMVQLVAFVIGVDQPTAQAIVDLVQAAIESDPGIDFDHPILTFNAFAFPEQVVPGLGPLPAKVIMGDGILEGLEAIGLGDVAPDFTLAHEMAHQVQYDLGIFSDGTPEGTRRTELMADGLATYELAHIRGATFQTKRLVDSVAVTFNVGDCDFGAPNHHGTPEQRKRAATWGVDLATSAHPRATIIPSDQLPALFDEALNSILSG